LQRAQSFDGFERARVVAAEFLEIELGGKQGPQSRFVVDLVVTKDGVEVVADFRREDVEGGIVRCTNSEAGPVTG
jgi:hypothetical protein